MTPEAPAGNPHIDDFATRLDDDANGVRERAKPLALDAPDGARSAAPGASRSA